MKKKPAVRMIGALMAVTLICGCVSQAPEPKVEKQGMEGQEEQQGEESAAARPDGGSGFGISE